ncbi:MAG: RNA-binding protein [Microgenomates group bacterium]
MAKRLFVGGLPYSITDSQLEEMFSKMGTVVSATVITDRDTGRSKGFGFVEMENDKEADEAIEKLNETELEGRKIAVNVARPREERPRSDNRGRGPRRDDRRPGRGGRR